MNLIYNNPYRILGLPVTAGEKEIARQINKLDTLAFAGKKITLDTDYPFLPDVDRSSDVIEEAKKQIEQDDGKVFYSLFWFWENNVVDELALEVLKEGNTNKAIEIWEKSALANKHKVFKHEVLNSNLIASSSHFSDADNERHLLKKNGDEYIVERKIESGSSIPTAYEDYDFEGNWQISCDTEWLSGVDNFGYGIVFGRGDTSYYTFQISANGQCRYGKTIDWAYTLLMDWKEDNSINKWGSNNVSIEKIDNILNFRINNHLVLTHDYEPLFESFYGFMVTNIQKISFRNFKFCKLVEDETYGKGLNVSSKNFSSIKNLSTLYLGLSTASTKGTFKISHFKKGVALAENVFANGEMKDYSIYIAGEKYLYNSEKLLHFYMNGILEPMSPFLDKIDGISTGELIKSFSTFPVEVKQFLNNRFVAKHFHNIEKAIEVAKEMRKNSGNYADEAGKKLVRETKEDIQYLKNILGEEEFQYQIIADKLSLAIVQCGIEAFNANKNENGDNDFAKAILSEESYLSNYEYAISIAVGQIAKEKTKENLDSCKEWISNKHLYFCYFCGSNPPSDYNKFEVTIYKETSRSYLSGRVQFSYLLFTIPRCADCRKHHGNNYNMFFIVTIAGAIIGAIIAAILSNGAFWFFGLLVGGAIGFFIKEWLKEQEASKSVIKDTSQSTIRNYPGLHKKLLEGWTFSKPSA